ncbi:MAG: serine/threonine dehydratase [Alphaproteobacteria bacterium]|nr:MAG: serine/threonine dehydratase [Alphaproteobacteria bacterium]
MHIPDIADITRAAKRLAGKAVRTPLVRSHILDAATGATVFVKPECLQVTGTFKFRGACNTILALQEQGELAHVVATSSGNHGQGVAEAARRLGVGATIVMPSDAPQTKIARTRRSGAEIVFYDRANEDREAIGHKVTADRGAVFIHPYDNPLVVAGQGTCGLEIAEQMDEAGAVPERLLVPAGGGGLTAGVTLAIHDRFPRTQVNCVEPEGFDDQRRSLETGRRLANARQSGSACDALMAPIPGEIAFAINRAHGVSGLTVSDAQAFAAMRFAFEELKLVVEPGGAVALAALLAADGRFAGETIACVLSGGNVDATLFARAIGAAG